MTIYHGGYQAVESPRIIKGEFAKDLYSASVTVFNF